MKTIYLSILVLVVLLVGVGRPALAQQPMVEKYLMTGKLSEGQKVLQQHLEKNPSDDQAQFGLGTLHFLQAVEHIGKSWYRFGVNENIRQIPFLRLPVGENKNPDKVTYQSVRSVLKRVIEHLDASDRALAKIKSRDVKLPLHIFQLHFDFNEDGRLTPEEDLTDIYGEYFGRRFANKKMLDETVVVFDYSDVKWLQGYTHLLRSMCEIILAHDMEPLWDVVGHHAFDRVDYRFKFMEEEFMKHQESGANRFSFNNTNSILDMIAGIHNMNFKIKEPERMKRAHQHLKQMVEHSREMWKSIMAEKDDDQEWIPNPNQSSSVTPARISAEMIKTWDEFLNEFSAILDGEKLIPFWRGTDKTRGVNVYRFFTEPHDLDVILWVHGSGAMPFIEYGDVTSEATWRRFQNVYRGQFFNFATWFN